MTIPINESHLKNMKSFPMPSVAFTRAFLAALLCASVAGTSLAQAAPQITITPSSQSVASGGRATFTATAISDPSPTVTYQYQWLFKGSPIAGATNNILHVDKILP